MYNLSSSQAFSISFPRFPPRKVSVILIPHSHDQASLELKQSTRDRSNVSFSTRRLNFSGLLSGILIMMAAIVIIR